MWPRLRRWAQGRRVASREIGTLDRASLERFQTELIEAGFEPRPGSQRTWVGPIASSLKELTAATKMQIVFVDGWPFRNPKLFVDGLDEWHLSATGEVCLWATGAAAQDWLTVEAFMRRVDEWAERAKLGFRPRDFALDSHLSFEKVRAGAIATVDLGSLGLGDKHGQIATIAGTWKNDDRVLELAVGHKGAIEGRSYLVSNVRVPPRSLDAVRAILTSGQRNNFDRRYRAISKQGQPRLFLIAWDREFGRELLVLLAQKRGEDVVAEAIEIALNDTEVLKLRAGPDVDTLMDRHVTVFGLGAVGSNLALRLAEGGVGTMILVDGARLRPGDVVRHAAGSWLVGQAKVNAVRLLAYTRAPWAKVTAIEESPWDPGRIGVLLEGADLVVDATGFSAFASLLSIMCGERSLPLVSAALYRGGAVARVRRQATTLDVPISDRPVDRRYPLIPPEEEPLVFEPGCSSPINNASPIAVAALAALTADVAVDSLTGRNRYGDETIDVYRPLAEAPFDKVGRVTR
jgi:molybdopterin/thiamine biosynthesis adenylyltransferase